jgi:hypothetical protein
MGLKSTTTPKSSFLLDWAASGRLAVLQSAYEFAEAG